MKKLITALLAAAMCLSLAACGSSNSSASAPASSTPAASASAASGETEWPTGTVSVILPYKAGGDTDTYCRALFQGVSQKLGQTFVVTNMEGGSGIVAAMDVMNTANDGYNILFNHTGASLVQEATDTVDFSYTEDFTNCCTVAIDQTYALVALSADGQYKNYAHGWTNLEDRLRPRPIPAPSATPPCSAPPPSMWARCWRSRPASPSTTSTWAPPPATAWRL